MVLVQLEKHDVGKAGVFLEAVCTPSHLSRSRSLYAERVRAHNLWCEQMVGWTRRREGRGRGTNGPKVHTTKNCSIVFWK